MWTLGKKIMLGYAVCMVLLIALSLAALHVLGSLREALALRNQQREILSALRKVFVSVQEVETAQRFYVVTGVEEDAPRIAMVRVDVTPSLDRLVELTTDKPWAAEALAMRDLIEAKLTFIAEAVAMRRQDGLEAAIRLARGGEGRRIMDEIRTRVMSIEQQESVVTKEFIARTERMAGWLSALILLGVPAASCVLMMAGLILSHHVASPVSRISREARRIAQGDMARPFPVSRRQDEIGQLERSFENMRAALEENRQQLLARNEALSALNSRLEEMTRAKSEFLAMMSHEIRTPLSAMMGYSNLLADTALTERQQACLATILASGKSLLTVINDVLDFSKIEAGKMTIEKEPFDLRRCLADTCELFRPGAEENGTTLACRVDDDVPTWVRGDPSRLRQVLSNLLSNAVRFTRDGRIDIHAHEPVDAAPAGFHLHVSVSDTGIGIPPEKRGQLFKSFDQLDPSIARKYGGTGLGLAICKRLCELMGGSIRVEDSSRQGTTFHFDIVLEPATEAEAKTVVHSEGTPDRDLLKTTRVVVAEDNPVNGALIVAFLEKYGVTARVVQNGREAVAAAPAADLVFMDVQMPEMDGLEATRAIRLNQNGVHRTHIVALTAEAMSGAAERCLAAGMDDYLSKPFRPADLDRALAKYCATRPSRSV